MAGVWGELEGCDKGGCGQGVWPGVCVARGVCGQGCVWPGGGGLCEARGVCGNGGYAPSR